MKNYEIHRNVALKQFVKNKCVSKDELYNFLDRHYLHPDYEREFTEQVARNAVNITHSFYLTLPQKERIHFLNALGTLCELSLSMKRWEFLLSRDDASWFWKDRPTYFLSMDHMIDPLETIRRELNIIDKRQVLRKIILVEGESEYNFIKTLYEITGYSNLEFHIHNYKGKGNLRNLVQYVQEKNRQAIKVILITDNDGITFVETLKKNKCKFEHIFSFSKDFENSFPPPILKQAIDNYINHYCNTEIMVSIEDIRKLKRKKRAFTKAFKENYNIELSKPKFANILGKIMAIIISYRPNGKYNHEKSRLEIFRFIRFLMWNWYESGR